MSGRIVGRAFHDGQPIRDATLRAGSLRVSRATEAGAGRSSPVRARGSQPARPPPAERGAPGGLGLTLP